MMHGTVFNGEVQDMVLADGRPNGMKRVLERGVNTNGMNANKMKELNKFENFKNKFHCELSAIERCWCHAKKHTRAHANGTITRLRTIIPEGLNTCTNNN